MENPYFYAEIKRPSSTQFIGLDGSLISGISICTGRLDTDSTGVNPLNSLNGLSGFMSLNVDFKLESIIESLPDNIYQNLLSNITTAEATVSSVYSSSSRSFQDWMQAINELNGKDIFNGAEINIWLCNGGFCGAIYQGGDWWRTPSYEYSIEITDAQWPFYRDAGQFAEKKFKGIIRSYVEKNNVISMDLESWDSELNKPITKKISGKSSRSSINTNPVIFGFTYPNFDGDLRSCFPAGQVSSGKSGSSFLVSALPLYEPNTKNVCIIDDQSGYCGINFNQIQIDDSDNRVVISTPTASTTSVARDAYQDWQLTTNERDDLVSSSGLPSGTPFTELPAFVEGEEIRIHTLSTRKPTEVSDDYGSAFMRPVAGVVNGGVVSRGCSLSKRKPHDTGEVYSESSNDAGVWMDVLFTVPPASMDDKAPIGFEVEYQPHERRGDSGDFIEFSRQEKFLQNVVKSSERSLVFGNNIFTNGVVDIPYRSEGISYSRHLRNLHLVSLRPEAIGSHENDLLINVIASIDYSANSCGASGDQGEETNQSNEVYIGINKYGSTVLETEKSGVTSSEELYNLIALPPLYEVTQAQASYYNTKRFQLYFGSFYNSATSEIDYSLSEIISNPYSSYITDSKEVRRSVVFSFDLSHLDGATLDSISATGTNADGNWFQHFIKLTTRQFENDEIYHSTFAINSYKFNIYVRKYLEGHCIYSTGYGAKSGLDGSLILDSSDAVREVLANFANAGGLLVAFTKPNVNQRITGWSTPDETARTIIRDLSSSSLTGIVLGSDGIVYDYSLNNGAIVKVINSVDIIAKNGKPAISKGVTSSEDLKTGLTLRFRQNPNDGDYGASYTINNFGYTDWTGLEVDYAEIDQLYNVDYWNLLTSQEIKTLCENFDTIYLDKQSEDILEVDARWLRDRLTAEHVLKKLCKQATTQRKIISFEGTIEGFYQVRIGQYVTWDLTATAYEDSSIDLKSFIVKKKTLNATDLTYSIVLEEIIS